MHHPTSSLFLPLLSLFLAAPLGGTSRSNFGQFHRSYRPREGSRTPAQKPQHIVRASSHKASRPARMFRIPSVFERGLEGGPTRRWAALLDDGRGVRVARNAARTEQVYLVARACRTRKAATRSIRRCTVLPAPRSEEKPHHLLGMRQLAPAAFRPCKSCVFGSAKVARGKQGNNVGTVKVEDARQQLVLDKEELKKKARRSARRVYKASHLGSAAP